MENIAKQLFKDLCECVSSDCDECTFLEYSTAAISHICNNKDSEYYGFMDTPVGCKEHSEIRLLKQKYNFK